MLTVYLIKPFEQPFRTQLMKYMIAIFEKPLQKQQQEKLKFCGPPRPVLGLKEK